MMEKIPTQSGTHEQMMSDLITMVQDAEAWLRNSGHLTGDEFKVAKAKFEHTLSVAKESLAEYQETAIVAAKATDDYVKQNPWKSVGVGVAIGAVLGMLFARR